MDLATIANIATALTVLAAVVFGLLEMRRARGEREERAAFAVMQALMTPTWVKSAVIVRAIPDGASAQEIEADPCVLEAAHSVSFTLEGMGYAVFARVVPLRVVDDLVGGTARVAWRKLRRYIEFERERAGSNKSWEWFEWLVDQMERHPQSPTSLSAGAAKVFRDWKP